MHNSLSKIVVVKVSIVAAAAVFAVTLIFGLGPSSHKASASASGPSPAFTAAPYIPSCPTCPTENNCTACHTGSAPNSGPGSVTISGIPANYLPNQQVPITVAVEDPNAVIYGFQLVAIRPDGTNAGTFNLPAADPQPLQIITGFVNGNERRYIEHTLSGVTPTQFGSKSWSFTWTAPSERIGRIGFYAAGNGANSDGGTSGDNIYLSSRTSLSGTAIANFDSDTRSDISVYRPSTGTWYVQTDAPPHYVGIQFGEPGDIPAPGDYDGDGTTDQAVFRPSNSTWYVRADDGGFTAIPFGETGDIPVPGDYDGDGRNDVAVWRPSSGTWYYLGTTQGFTGRQFGQTGDRPAQGDFDGDGATDLVVFRPAEGVWYLLLSKNAGFTATQFGQEGDTPVPADYDGDGKTDISVFRPEGAVWYRINATEGFIGFPFGEAGDKPAPADYNGDGRADVAVFRNGVFFTFTSEGFTPIEFGQAGDIPVASAYIQQ